LDRKSREIVSKVAQVNEIAGFSLLPAEARLAHTTPVEQSATKPARKPRTSAKPDDSIIVDGNRLTLITDGPERLDALLKLIDEAKSSLRLLFYMFASDASGTLARDALIRAAERGVEVWLLTDRFGCSDVKPEFTRPLIDAGIHFCQFHPSWGRRYLLRNHQKMAIADGERCIVGGSNVSDAYFGTAQDNAWRDLWLLVDGPAAERLGTYFDAVMGWALKKGARIRTLRKIIFVHSESEGALQWQFSGPMRRASPLMRVMLRELASARDVAMIAAYFSPPRAFIRRLCRVGRRGRARLITASRSDNTTTIYAARYTYPRLIRNGVEVFEYQPTKLHTKLLIADDVTHIGSSNFDYRSLYLNMEIMLRIDDARFAKRMRAYFDGETAHSRQITRAVYRQHAGLWKRIKWAVSHWLVTAVDYTVTRKLNFPAET
jgi:cardiolipin synthase